MEDNGATIYIWDDGAKQVELLNLKSGKSYSFVLKKSVTVGRKRNKCDVQITKDDTCISGCHLQFTLESGKVYVEDLQSLNGTKLNGKRIWMKEQIHSGDKLELGKTVFHIHFKKV